MDLRLCSVFAFLLRFAFVSASCDCGFTTDVEGTDGPVLFTDVIETDFYRLRNMKESEDFRGQTFNKSPEKARGEYGEMFHSNNVQLNPDGASTGLELVVGSTLVDDMVPVSEVATKRADLYYGTFRANIKLTREVGTCAAFYWYFNDSQEIDMEFLSKDFNFDNGSFPVNIVLHSRDSVAAGFDAQKAGTWTVAYLPFDPTADFHEYRFDYVPGSVYFYADGKSIAQMNGTAVPTQAGRLLLSQWSNGNAKWSGGPPTQNATVQVGYVKSYFNSSDTAKQQEWQGRCPDAKAANATCRIPSVLDDPNAKTTFFTDVSPEGEKKNGGNTAFGIPAASLSWGFLLWASYCIASL